MILILMGVTGSGKTTVGKKLAEVLACPFIDADDYHSQANKEKMSQGVALTDEDREPWLADLSVVVKLLGIKSPLSVLACSALKRKYRDLLSASTKVRWIYLKGGRELLNQRLEGRLNHFANPKLLESQLESLEEPEDALVIDIKEDLGKIVGRIVQEVKG